MVVVTSWCPSSPGPCGYRGGPRLPSLWPGDYSVGAWHRQEDHVNPRRSLPRLEYHRRGARGHADHHARYVHTVRSSASAGPHLHLDDQPCERADRSAHDRRRAGGDRRGAWTVPVPGRSRGHPRGRPDPRAGHSSCRRAGSVRSRADLAGPLRIDLHERAGDSDARPAAPSARHRHERHRHRTLGPRGEGDGTPGARAARREPSATASPPTSPASTTATARAPTTCAEKRRSISSTAIAP